jgi:hypothetical protein
VDAVQEPAGDDNCSQRGDTGANGGRSAETLRRVVAAWSPAGVTSDVTWNMKGREILHHALHPIDAHMQTVEEYWDEFSKHSEAARPTPRCPVCGGDLYVMQLHDREHRKQFSHVMGERSPCPLVNDKFDRQLFVKPRALDRALEVARKADFVSHWALHFQIMRQHVPTLTVERFKRLVEQANVLHLWSCKELDVSDLPYIFLVLAEFIAETPGAPYPKWFRFWFDASVNEVADLRRPGKPSPQFFRLHYRPSRQFMFPSARHLIDWHEALITSAPQNVAVPRLSAYEVENFERFLEETDKNPVGLGLEGKDNDAVPSPMRDLD